MMLLDGDFSVFLFHKKKPSRKHAEITFNNIFNKLSYCIYLFMCLYQ